MKFSKDPHWTCVGGRMKFSKDPMSSQEDVAILNIMTMYCYNVTILTSSRVLIRSLTCSSIVRGLFMCQQCDI